MEAQETEKLVAALKEWWRYREAVGRGVDVNWPALTAAERKLEDMARKL